jgi:hypothetical protein
MSIATDTKVAKLEVKLDALLERMEIIEAHLINNNAVVEGDEIEIEPTPRAARNGKIRKANR